MIVSPLLKSFSPFKTVFMSLPATLAIILSAFRSIRIVAFFSLIPPNQQQQRQQQHQQQNRKQKRN